MVLECARLCLMVVKREVFNIRTNRSRFANNRPMGQEVVEWLCEKRISSYVPIFLHHGLDSLLSVKNLTREQVSLLAKEFRDIYGMVREQGSAYTSEANIWQAIKALDSDPRARKISERLEWFEDSAASWHSRGETQRLPQTYSPAAYVSIRQHT